LKMLAQAAARRTLFPSNGRNVRALVLRSSMRKRAATTAAGRAGDAVATASPQYTPKYVPGGPIYKGTINDPTEFPAPSRAHGSHHWSFERLLSASLIPMIGAAAATSTSPYPILDGVLALSLVVHSHIGFDGVLTDYLHKRKFPIWGPLMTWVLRFSTAGALVGVYQFNTNDVGFTELVRRVWKA